MCTTLNAKSCLYIQIQVKEMRITTVWSYSVWLSSIFSKPFHVITTLKVYFDLSKTMPEVPSRSKSNESNIFLFSSEINIQFYHHHANM
ncbi:CLUMA_CG018372, isoform A [Clunio marinus]|uniref:CLUMA_CG018372, isoform A n=1 Tax=Clunio marinus TaxID=568069 RepID=A0A1J1IZ23_9DIPT|nr:CLUMA_CG018372, isoform A [Clunio marinus]